MASERVVLIHGLWMTGLEMGVLKHRLQHDHGFDVHVFAYPTMHGDTLGVARDLAQFARALLVPGQPLHYVGHSLGGALVYKALVECGAPAGGNAVLIGAPINGSRAADAVSRNGVLNWMLGPHVPRELAQPCGRSWQGPGALGAIAGSRRIGTGQFFADFSGEHDGSVAVEETIIPGLSDHIVLPHSHMGLIFAADVAEQVAHFLRHARFAR